MQAAADLVALAAPDMRSGNGAMGGCARGQQRVGAQAGVRIGALAVPLAASQARSQRHASGTVR